MIFDDDDDDDDDRECESGSSGGNGGDGSTNERDDDGKCFSIVNDPFDNMLTMFKTITECIKNDREHKNRAMENSTQLLNKMTTVLRQYEAAFQQERLKAEELLQ